MIERQRKGVALKLKTVDYCIRNVFFLMILGRKAAKDIDEMGWGGGTPQSFGV